MNYTPKLNDADVINHAIADYLLDAVVAKSKHKHLKSNMECRRKLEIIWEDLHLKRAIAEFDFN